MNLFVGNLDFKVKSNDLAELFGQYGKVTSARVITDKETGRSRGFGFVEMENESEAKSAIEKLNGTDFRNPGNFRFNYQSVAERGGILYQAVAQWFSQDGIGSVGSKNHNYADQDWIQEPIRLAVPAGWIPWKKSRNYWTHNL